MQQKTLPWTKDTFYRFLFEPRINWRCFLLLVSTRIIDRFLHQLTEDKKDRVLVLDDSTYSSSRPARACYTRSYDSLVAHTSIVFLRYMMLCFEQRRAKNE